MKRLPKKIPTYLGSVPVELVKDLKSPKGEECFGYWNAETRTIQIRANIAPAVQRQALLHEMVHVAIWDAGLHNSMTEELIEALCDTIASFYVGSGTIFTA